MTALTAVTGPQDPPVTTGPWWPKQTEMLAVLHARDGYPDLCRRGIWWAVVPSCAAPDPIIPNLANPATAGGAQ